MKSRRFSASFAFRPLLFIVFLVVVLRYLVGCGNHNTAERADQESVQRQQEHYQVAQPVPWFDWSEERDASAQIYRARNEQVNTWTVWRSDTGIVEGWCPSVGYPLPYDVSFTNPWQPIRVYNHGTVAVGQAEPNGLFASQNSIATWVRCLHGKQVVPTYIESKVTAYAVPITVTGNVVTPVTDAAPSVTIKNNKGRRPVVPNTVTGP